MPYFSKYHLREQPAYALLSPMRASLRELERRARHYVERVALAPADQEAIRAAHEAITAARAEVERLWQASAR
jgi:hypothetical protein